MNSTPYPRGRLLEWLNFTLAPGVTTRQQRSLLKMFETPRHALDAPFEEVAMTHGGEIADGLRKGASGTAVEEALRWLAEPGHYLVTLHDDAYPGLLREIPDAPSVLYVQGRIELLRAECLAIVGSRNATAQGVRDAEGFARALSRAGYTIVSGLALGIDAAAHRGGLAEAGSSIAVMGTGADLYYPRRNRELADRLAREGAIISEWPLGTPPAPGNFPQRNRLISGLSRGVLVVEAAMQSGSLITARLAADQGREVFAMPGSIHSTVSKGCHELIKQGAKLAEDAADVLAELGGMPAPRACAAVPSEAVHPLLAALGHGPATVDQLAGRTGSDAAKIAAELSRLEIEGSIAALPGGRFQRLGD